MSIASGHIDFKRLAADVKARASITEVVSMRVDLKRMGRRYGACCPFHKEKTPSFFVDPDKKSWRCYGACAEGGSAIDFIMKTDGIDFKEATLMLAKHFGITPPESDGRALIKKVRPENRDVKRRQAASSSKITKARSIVFNAMPATGTKVETYLQSRAIQTDRLPPAVFKQLRFNPRMPYYYEDQVTGDFKLLGHFAAMIAPLQDCTSGVVKGAHITYIKSDGSDKLNLVHPQTGKALPSKKMRGEAWGTCVKLGPVTPTMQVTEGIENGLCALMLKPHYSVEVSASIGNMAGGGHGQGQAHPDFEGRKLPSVFPDMRNHGYIPPGRAERIIYIEDGDTKDIKAGRALMDRAVRRAKLLGYRAEIMEMPIGYDLNDLIKGAA